MRSINQKKQLSHSLSWLTTVFVFVLFCIPVYFNFSLTPNTEHTDSFISVSSVHAQSNGNRGGGRATNTQDPVVHIKQISGGKNVLANNANNNSGSLYVDVLDFFSGILVFMATLLDIVANPKFFSAFFVGEGSNFIQKGWTFVRDFLNVFFILILLFSAFSTIFQVEKFHLKKTLLSLVIAALLVNFSWPIARVIIDAGNVIMYFFLSALVPAEVTSLSGLFAQDNGIGDIITNAKADDMSLLQVGLRLILIAAFAITIGALAFILLIRIVMFIILLVFSPLGFVASILPSTQKFAAMWWDNMIKWSFIGPIIVFMMILSIQVLKTYNYSGTGLEAPTASSIVAEGVRINAAYTGMQTLFVQGVPIIVSLVILWAGIIAAQQMGGAAAGFVTSRAKGIGLGGLKKIRSGSWKGIKRAAMGRKDKKTGEYTGGIGLRALRGLDQGRVSGRVKAYKDERQRRVDQGVLDRSEKRSTVARNSRIGRKDSRSRAARNEDLIARDAQVAAYGDTDEAELNKIMNAGAKASHGSQKRINADAARIALNNFEKAIKDTDLDKLLAGIKDQQNN